MVQKSKAFSPLSKLKLTIAFASANYYNKNMEQDDSLKDLREAFSKMAASFFKMAEAVGQAKKMFDRLMWQEYKEAGYPFGDSQEGLQRWMDIKKKTDGISAGVARDNSMEACHAGQDEKLPSFVDNTRLSIEIKKRLN